MSSLNSPDRVIAATSVPAAVASAFGLLGLAWRRAWIILLVASGAVGGWLQLTAGQGRSPASIVGLAVVGLVGVAATAALCRLALGRNPASGWGGDEWRVLAAGLLMGLLALVLAMLLLVLVVCVAYAVAAAGRGFVAADPATWARAVEGRGRVVVGIVAVIGAAAIAWVMLRVALAPVASVATGRVQVLSTWPLTRATVWSILAAMIWVGLTPAGLWLVLGSVSRFIPPRDAWIVGGAQLARGLVLMGIWLPLKIGVMGYFQRRLAFDSP